MSKRNDKYGLARQLGVKIKRDKTGKRTHMMKTETSDGWTICTQERCPWCKAIQEADAPKKILDLKETAPPVVDLKPPTFNLPPGKRTKVNILKGFSEIEEP